MCVCMWLCVCVGVGDGGTDLGSLKIVMVKKMLRENVIETRLTNAGFSLVNKLHACQF